MTHKEATVARLASRLGVNLDGQPIRADLIVEALEMAYDAGRLAGMGR